MSSSPETMQQTTPLSFFARVGAELAKLFHHVPSWEASAAATITYVAPMIDVLVSIADPTAAPVVAALLTKVQSAMAAAAVVIKMAGPTPTLLTYLSAINENLAQVEAAAQIKDPVTAAKLATVVSAITTEINAIREEVGGLPTPTAG